MTDGKQMRIGIPKGSLEEATIAFAKAGWKTTSHHRNYFLEINDPDLTCPRAGLRKWPATWKAASSMPG